MRIALYVGRAFAGALLLVLAGLVVLVVAVNLIESAGDLTEHNAGALVALRLALFGSVEYAYQVLPIACFLGALVAGTQLARRGELLAVQAAGVGPRRLWASFFTVALVTVLLGSACGEYGVPRALTVVQRVEAELSGSSDRLTRPTRRNSWYQHGDLVLFLPAVDSGSEVFTNPVIYRLAAGEITELIEAERLLQVEGRWRLEQARRHVVATGATERYDQLSIELGVAARDLIEVAGNPRQMRAGEIRQIVQRRRQAGFDTTPYRIELQSRVAYPLLGLWMLLLAAPWTFDPDRRRSLAVTLGGGVVIIAMLLAIMQMFRLAALGRSIPVVLGAWGVSLVCITVLPLSLLLYRRYRRRGAIW